MYHIYFIKKFKKLINHTVVIFNNQLLQNRFDITTNHIRFKSSSTRRWELPVKNLATLHE